MHLFCRDNSSHEITASEPPTSFYEEGEDADDDLDIWSVWWRSKATEFLIDGRNLQLDHHSDCSALTEKKLN